MGGQDLAAELSALLRKARLHTCDEHGRVPRLGSAWPRLNSARLGSARLCPARPGLGPAPVHTLRGRALKETWCAATLESASFPADSIARAVGARSVRGRATRRPPPHGAEVANAR